MRKKIEEKLEAMLRECVKCGYLQLSYCCQCIVILPIEDLQESEDSKRGRLFKRWLEVSARVESVQNMMVKTDLQAYLERLSVKIGGNDVTKLETEIKQELESLWRAVIYSTR